MFSNSRLEQDYQVFLAGWEEDVPGIKALFMEIVRRLNQTSRIVVSFIALDPAGGAVRAMRPDMQRPLIALLEFPEDSPAPCSLSIRFYDNAVDDPKSLGDWIPRGLLGEDARSFTVEKNQPALADYVLECLDGVLRRLPE